MSNSAGNVLALVRNQILRGERVAGEKISEVGIAAELDVSRTPARTALAALEAEGLIEKRDGRGYSVKSISAADVGKSIEVRSVLEGLAARTLAINGMSAETKQKLLGAIRQTQQILDHNSVIDNPEELMDGYQEANLVFHQTIMQDCGNELIVHTFERIARLPLAALGTLAFTRGDVEQQRMRLTVGHSQHVIIFDALNKRDAARAEAMMREHSMATLNYTDLFVNGIHND